MTPTRFFSQLLRLLRRRRHPDLGCFGDSDGGTGLEALCDELMGDHIAITVYAVSIAHNVPLAQQAVEPKVELARRVVERFDVGIGERLPPLPTMLAKPDDPAGGDFRLHAPKRFVEVFLGVNILGGYEI